jgi:DNA (cytosine-5)-methyltransferase 1
MMTALGFKPSKPNREIDLGDPALLHMVMSDAAEYFDVRKPSTKRDRKSGAKKRSQAEIEAARVLSTADG